MHHARLCSATRHLAQRRSLLSPLSSAGARTASSTAPDLLLTLPPRGTIHVPTPLLSSSLLRRHVPALRTRDWYFRYKTHIPIMKKCTLRNWKDARALAESIAELAQEEQHYPGPLLTFKPVRGHSVVVTVRLITHRLFTTCSTEGVTVHDLRLAWRLDRLFRSSPLLLPSNPSVKPPEARNPIPAARRPIDAHTAMLIAERLRKAVEAEAWRREAQAQMDELVAPEEQEKAGRSAKRERRERERGREGARERERSEREMEREERERARAEREMGREERERRREDRRWVRKERAGAEELVARVDAATVPRRHEQFGGRGRQ